MPPWMRRAAGAIHLEHPVQAFQIEADRAGEAVADGRLDPAHHVEPPPNGIAAPASAAHSRTAATSSSDCGRATTSGARSNSRANARTASGNDLP